MLEISQAKTLSIPAAILFLFSIFVEFNNQELYIILDCLYDTKSIQLRFLCYAVYTGSIQQGDKK